ncbi:hypothetical protein U9M48_030325 [Paspalum notatum var. saurae]|uniref:Uncharacterized protein n=1 Tax=Paspalum notatum var. saurae TaxID=547442 RepID=A0AAQ3U3E3_PASNO
MGNAVGAGLGLGLGIGAAIGAIGAASLAQAADPDVGHLQKSSADPDVGHLQKSSEAYQCNTEDIDESSAEVLCDAMRYVKDNMMMIQVQVLGTTKKFWRLTDEATRISRKLALILRSHHLAGKSLTAPLQVSNVWIGRTTGSVKLRDVSFTCNYFSIKRVRDDYKHLFMVLVSLISISCGNNAELPPDYLEFLLLLRSNTLTMKDEFLIVNHAALLPMKNRTEVFLMLHNIIVKYLGRTKQGREKKKRILSKLPYNDWLDTAKKNQIINQWVDDVEHQYRRTSIDLLRLNRNVRCHSHDYGDADIEEVLYCEWPELLMVMEKLLHLEGELEGTDIQNKFG